MATTKSQKFAVECMECGRKFKTSGNDPECPKCGGVDIDLPRVEK